MLAKAMKSISIAALLLSFLWCFFARDQVWSVQVGGYLEVLVLVVWATALMVAAQTVLAHKYFLGSGIRCDCCAFQRCYSYSAVSAHVSHLGFALHPGFHLRVSCAKDDTEA